MSDGTERQDETEEQRRLRLSADGEQVAKRILDRLARAQALENRAKSNAGDTEKPEPDADSAQSDEETSATSLSAVKLRQSEQKLKQRKQDMKLRKKLSNYAIWIVMIQLIVANVFFGFYLWNNPDDPDASVMIAWLSATVVEVIGILWVIARNLFPYRDKSSPRSGKDTRGGGTA